jgi:hypothetical protein
MFPPRVGEKSEWMRSPELLKGVTNAAQNAKKEEKKNQPESVSFNESGRF